MIFTRCLGAAFLLASLAPAQITLPNAVPLPTARSQFLDQNGKPCVGCLLWTYAAGTSTPQATYTDSTAAAMNTNPIVLNSQGAANVWIGGQNFKLVLERPPIVAGHGTQLWAVDNVADTTFRYLSHLQTISDSALLSYTNPSTGAAARTVRDKLNEYLSVKDFGAKGDGTTDDTAALTAAAAAVNALPSSTGHRAVLTFPQGTYKYSSGLDFTKPVLLEAYGAVLNYTGSGKAIKLGPDGLTSATFEGQEDYSIEGMTLTGGALMTHGIYVNSYVVRPTFRDIYMLDFGNSTAWGFFFQSNNWKITMENCTWHTTYSGGSDGRNWVRVHGFSAAGVGDAGASYIKMNHCLGHQFNPNGGIGVYIGGAFSTITDSEIAGFTPNVQLGGYAYHATITNTHMELIGSTGTKACVGFGDSYGAPAELFWTEGLTIRDSTCDVHHFDLSTGGSFLAPTTTFSNLQNSQIVSNRLSGYNSTLALPFIVLNNLAQTNNYASANFTTGLDYPTLTRVKVLHSTGSAITAWTGGDELNSYDKPALFFDPTTSTGVTSTVFKPGEGQSCAPFAEFRDGSWTSSNIMEIRKSGCSRPPVTVVGTDSATTGIVSAFAGTAANGAYLWQTDGTNFNWAFGAGPHATGDNWTLYTDRFPGTAGVKVLDVGKGNGRVRIGVPLPTDDGASQLQVNGPIRAVGALSSGGGSAGKAVCWKSDGKTLGYCSTQPNSVGACTCN